MSKAKHVLAGMIAACAAGAAFSQTTGQAPAQQQSSDAFVNQRNEKKETKKEFKSGQINKPQYDQDRAQQKKDLKASGQRGAFEQNLDAPQPTPTPRSKK